jgi:hypothetical protein
MRPRRAAAILFVCCAALQAQEVTATKWVEDWESGKRKTELRKINGRWWTQDNREVTPPGPGQVFWTPDSRPGTTTFYHHRPFEVARAERLHLLMSPPEVEAALGQPNRTFGFDERQHGFWFYYAADGTKLSVRFMGQEDGLGEATYNEPGRKPRPVASVAADLAGRDIYKLMSERATQRNRQAYANRIATRRGPSVTTVSSVPLSQSDPAPAKRIISMQAYSGIAVGAARADVLARLGEPNSRYAITDDDGTHESFTYDLDNGQTVVIHLLSGKVTERR